MVKNLSEFLGVPEGTTFKLNTSNINLFSSKLKIVDNVLMIKRKNDKDYSEANISVNELIDCEVYSISKPILTDEEKEWLKNLIKNANVNKNDFLDMVKMPNEEDGGFSIIIHLCYGNTIISNAHYFHSFENMEDNKEYSLADLDLED